jgi:hypothetical protein
MFMQRLRGARRASVGLMFALGAIPIIGLVGIAVDYGIWNETNAELSVAANVAALSAVKIAANAQLATDPNASTEGQQAGQQWFLAEVGTFANAGPEGLLQPAVTVTMTMGPTVSAQVAYSGKVPSVFGGIFGVAKYPISGQATAAEATAPYLDVEMLADNSSSMDIGATPADMAQLQQLSACDPSNVNWTNGPNAGTQSSQNPYKNYAYTGYGGRSYDGPLTYPVVLTGGTQGNIQLIESLYLPGGTLPVCKGFSAVKQPNSTYASAGPPCEFACHWDSSHNSGYAADLYGAARKTLGTSKPITLRFDLVKNALYAALTAMQADDQTIHNLRAGVFTFNNQINQIYPASGEAADDWSTALTDVGLPPTQPYQEETGIIPVVAQVAGNNSDTEVVESLNSLRTSYLTANSGDGTKATTPRKVLFLVTDGFVDDPIYNSTPPNYGRYPFPTNPSPCDQFKNAGYTVYVVFTPYYAIQHQVYLSFDWSAIIYGPNGGGPNGNAWTDSPGTLADGLEQCASSKSDYISATDGPSLQAALQTFLKAALNQPALFTH